MDNLFTDILEHKPHEDEDPSFKVYKGNSSMLTAFSKLNKKLSKNCFNICMEYLDLINENSYSFIQISKCIPRRIKLLMSLTNFNISDKMLEFIIDCLPESYKFINQSGDTINILYLPMKRIYSLDKF